MRALAVLTVAAALCAADVWAQSSRQFPELGKLKLSLGEESEPSPDLFSTIRAVAFDRAGRIYVLDAGDNSVRAFDRNGRFLGRAGRAGRGPADLAYPHTMLHDGDSTLYVVDELNGILQFFTGNKGVRYERSFGSDLFPRSTCKLGSEFVVGGFKDEKMVHVVNARAVPLRSFGAAINPDTSLLIRMRANREPVIVRCDERHRRVLLSEVGGPGVQVYSTDGRLIWSKALPDFQGVRYLADKKSVTAFWGNDFTESVHLVQDSIALVQVRRIRRLPGGSGRNRRVVTETVSVTTYALDLASGRLLGVTKSLPLIRALEHGQAAVVFEDPFPRVEIREIVRD